MNHHSSDPRFPRLCNISSELPLGIACSIAPTPGSTLRGPSPKLKPTFRGFCFPRKTLRGYPVLSGALSFHPLGLDRPSGSFVTLPALAGAIPKLRVAELKAGLVLGWDGATPGEENGRERRWKPQPKCRIRARTAGGIPAPFRPLCSHPQDLRTPGNTGLLCYLVGWQY